MYFLMELTISTPLVTIVMSSLHNVMSRLSSVIVLLFYRFLIIIMADSLSTECILPYIVILAASAGSVGEYTVIVWKKNFKLSSLCGETFLS